jgi:hypothetical protein
VSIVSLDPFRCESILTLRSQMGHNASYACCSLESPFYGSSAGTTRR